MNRLLAGLPRPRRVAGAADLDAGLARLGDRAGQAGLLLAALAWGRGPGLPEGVWVAVARALAEVTGQDAPVVTQDDPRRLLRRTKGLVTQCPGPGGLPVYRVSDDTLAARLRAAPAGAAGEHLGSPGWRSRCERAVTAGLLATVPLGAVGRQWAAAHPYLRVHLPGHAGDAGGDELAALLADFGFLAVADPAVVGPLLSFPAPELRDVGRAYWRVRPLLGAEPRLCMAYLAEAFHGLTSTPPPDTGVVPLYRTRLTLVSDDDSLLTISQVSGGPAGGGESLGLVNAVEFGTAGGGQLLLASGGEDGTVHVWDPLTAVRVSGPLRGHAGWVNSVAFGTVTGEAAVGGDRLLLASGGRDGTVRVWDPVSGEPVSVLAGHTGWVLGVCFGTSPDGRLLLASASVDGTVRVWDPLTGTPVCEPLTGHQPSPAPTHMFTPTVNDVSFGIVPREGECPERLLLASAGIDRTVRLWDPQTGTPVAEPLRGHSGSVLCVEFGTSPDGRLLLASSTGAPSCTIRLWDPVTGTSLWELARQAARIDNLAFGTVAGDAQQEGAGQFLLASAGGTEKAVCVWDALTGAALGAPLTGHTNKVYDVAFGTTPDGRLLLASGGQDATIRLWDPSARPAPRQTSGPARWVEAVALWRSPQGTVLAAYADGAAGGVVVWDVLAGSPVGSPLGGHRGRVLCLGFGSGPGGPLLASAGEDGLVRVWHPLTGALATEPLAGHTKDVRAVAFGAGPGGQPLLASAGDDALVRVWHPLTGEPISTLAGHLGGTDTVAFAAGEAGEGAPLLASGGQDGLVRVWHPLTGALATPPLAGHGGVVRSVGFAGTVAGRPPLLASGGDDQAVRLWDPVSGTAVGKPLTGHTGWVHAVVSGNGPAGQPLLFSAGGDQTVRVWNPDDGSCLAVIGRRSPVRSLAATGLTVALGEDDGMCVLELDSTAVTGQPAP